MSGVFVPACMQACVLTCVCGFCVYVPSMCMGAGVCEASLQAVRMPAGVCVCVCNSAGATYLAWVLVLSALGPHVVHELMIILHVCTSVIAFGSRALAVTVHES